MPADEPVPFAPGWVSTGMYERDLTVTPNGDEIFFTVVLGNFERAAILTARMRPDGTWPAPRVASFSGRYRDLEPALAPNGSRLYFVSNRPLEGDGPPLEDSNLWVVERNGDGWGAPRPLPPPVRSDTSEFFPSVTRDGTLYFTRDGEGGASTIFRARPDGDGGFALPEELPREVNSVVSQFNGWIDADESVLVFAAFGRDDSVGRSDYYAAFRDTDDRWSGPVHLGDRVNTPSGLEYAASLSPDGRILFFMSARPSFPDHVAGLPRTRADLAELHAAPGNGLPDIYWIDAGFLHDLRP
jgi:Tol biopolymer transport system component